MNMINVLICEDEQRYRNQLREMLIRLSFSLDIEIHTFYFHSAEELLNAYDEREKEYDLLFMDIELPGNNGLQAAKILREEYHYDGQLVFLSSHSEMMQDSFEVGTNQYLVKPVEYEEFKRKLLPILKHIMKSNQRITVELVTGGFRILHLQSILSIHSNNVGRKGGVIIQTEKEQIMAFGKMNEFLEKLGNQSFFRIHKQTIVNLDHVMSFDNESVTLSNSQVLKISRNLKKDFKERMINFI